MRFFKKIILTIKKYSKIILIFTIFFIILCITLEKIFEYYAINIAETIFEVITAISTAVLTVISLYLVSSELVNNETITKYQAKKLGKKISEIINNVNPDFIIMIDGNACEYFRKFVHPFLKESKPELIVFTCEERTKTKKFYLKNRSAPNWLIITNKFYLHCNSDSLNSISNKKIIVFDDVVRTGETCHKVVKYIQKNKKITKNCFFLICLIIDRNIIGSNIFNCWMKSGDLKDNYDYCWRKKNE